MKDAERLAKVETELKDMKERNSDEHKKIEEKLDKFIESADSRYANKITERIVNGLVALILVGIATGILTHVFGVW